MTIEHPELIAEQAYVDEAYACLEAARTRALQLTAMVEVGRGGTNQARFEREAIQESVANRLDQLDMGDASLVFGRIDQEVDAGGGRYYIGRVGVWGLDQEPVLVDWRAPVAEPFYRATGPVPMGLKRRRHFVSRGRSLLGMEDELFGDLDRFRDDDRNRLRGEGALIAALETARTGRLGDIVGTIQAEQDEIIRAALPGVHAVQGGPGTGKTVVALHRAAYLLYTHRFPLAGQGVLVVGPNRLFLAYIEQVLPSLGEAGVVLATVGDVVGGVRVDDRRELDGGEPAGHGGRGLDRGSEVDVDVVAAEDHPLPRVQVQGADPGGLFRPPLRVDLTGTGAQGRTVVGADRKQARQGDHRSGAAGREEFPEQEHGVGGQTAARPVQGEVHVQTCRHAVDECLSGCGQGVSHVVGPVVSGREAGSEAGCGGGPGGGADDHV